jgi:hypothetical protein
LYYCIIVFVYLCLYMYCIIVYVEDFVQNLSSELPKREERLWSFSSTVIVLGCPSYRLGCSSYRLGCSSYRLGCSSYRLLDYMHYKSQGVDLDILSYMHLPLTY